MNENMSKEQNSAESSTVSSNCQKSCKMCWHGMCGCGHRHFFWLRLLLGLIILAAVFCVGVKVGEFKGEFGRGFGRQGNYNVRYFRQDAYPLGVPGGMMQFQTRMMTQPNTSTTTPTK
jgi:hypothetical protein